MKLQALLGVFGVASGIYKVSLVLVLSVLIAQKYPVVGLLLAASYVAMEATRFLRLAIRTFFLSPDTEPVRRRASVVGFLVLGLLPVAVCALPVPSKIVAPATLSALHEEVLRAERPGVLVALRAEPASQVLQGQELVVLEDSRVEESIAAARGQVERNALELRAARGADSPRTAELERQSHYLELELETSLRERDKLALRASMDGELVQLVSPEGLGRFVAEGEPLATVASGPVLVNAVLTEIEVERARPAVGTRIEFRAASDPGRTLTGWIVRIAPVGADALDEAALADVGAGDVRLTRNGTHAGIPHFAVTARLDPAPGAHLLHGGSGTVQFHSTLAPIGKIALRRLLHLRNRLANRG